MATDEQFIRGTVNEALGSGRSFIWYDAIAAGQRPHEVPNPNAPGMSGTYNGGIYCRRVGRLEKGDILFRFSDSSKLTLESRFAGDWWFDLECFKTIRWAGRLQNTDFTSAARSHLGMDWGDMKNLVGGRLTADFWCIKGLTGAVDGKQVKLSGPLRTDVVQIFVPGGLTLAYFTEVHENVLTSGIV